MKKILALILAIVMLLSLTACELPNPIPGGNPGGSQGQGEEGEDPSPTPTPTPQSQTKTVTDYASAYEFWCELGNQIGDTLDKIVEANNAKLEQSNPEDYFSDSNYLLFLLLPFLSVDLAMTATFNEEITAATVETAFGLFGLENVQYSHPGVNRYGLSYTGKNYITEENYDCQIEAEYLPGSKGISYKETHTINGHSTVDEFYQFLALGNDKYVMQSNGERALITLKNGEITQLYYSTNRYEVSYSSELPDDIVRYDVNKDSILNKKSFDSGWVYEKGDELSAKYTIESGKLTVVMNKCTTQRGEDGWTPVGRIYEWAAPVVITID